MDDKKTTIFRTVKSENPFAQIDKRLINNKELTWKTKGILIYLLSKPNDWTVQVDDIINNAKDGRDAVYSAIQEAIKYGYIAKKRLHDENGKFAGFEYEVYESPIESTIYGKTVYGKSVNGNTINGKTVYGKSVNGKTVNTKKTEEVTIYGKSDTTNNNIYTNNELTNNICDPPNGGSQSGNKQDNQILDEGGNGKHPKAKNKQVYICADRDNCKRCNWHVLEFARRHEEITEGVRYDMTQADFGQAKRIHKVYDCSLLIKYQELFWEKFESDPKAWSSQRLSFTVFVAAIKDIIAEQIHKKNGYNKNGQQKYSDGKIKPVKTYSPEEM